MTKLSRLGLGTVQFGLAYGVSNRRGRPDEAAVAAILARALETGVGYLDTAPAYGDAERLIGRHLPAQHKLRIVTKTPAIAEAEIGPRHAALLLESVAESLRRLRADSLYGLIVHNAADLAKPGWQHIVEALNETRARGLISRIGVSVYSADQLALAEGRFKVQLVQLPLNALDRRPIATGMLARLKAAGAEIHARSVFLQGLLLMRPDEVPDFFAPIRNELGALRRAWADRNLTALAGCLAFVLTRPEIDVAIVGVNDRTEFDDIIAALDRDVNLDGAIALPGVDARFLDPSRWPQTVH